MRIVARRLDDQLIILRCLDCGHIEKCTRREMAEKTTTENSTKSQGSPLTMP